MTSHQPLWSDTAQEPAIDARLKADATCDVAIIGGGYTGLSTALHGAQAGLDCHVLEADQIGAGGSGRNAGLVNAGLWVSPQEVRRRMGPDRGADLVAALGHAPDKVFSLIEQHQIRCDPQRNGTIHAAHAVSGVRDLQGRVDEWQRLGAPVEMLSRDMTIKMTGSHAFHGGLLDHRAGTINPLSYARGLARAAAAAGARISTNAPVQGLHRDGEFWLCQTPQGALRARRVVIATNAYGGSLWPGLERCFVPVHFVQIACKLLGAHGDTILPHGQGLWDTAKILTAVRRDAGGRIIIGTMGRAIGGSGGLTARWANRTLRRLFPDLGDVTFDHAWHGTIAFTDDHLPRILQLDDGVYAPIGYNGRGIAPGTVFGMAMAGLLTGGQEAELPLAVTSMQGIRLRGLKSVAFDAAFLANQMIRSL